MAVTATNDTKHKWIKFVLMRHVQSGLKGIACIAPFGLLKR